MKGKDVAAILLQNPEAEVVFLSFGGEVRVIEKVIKCNLATSKHYSFEKEDCLLVDDGCRVRKSWLESVKGEVFPDGDFIHDDTKGQNA